MVTYTCKPINMDACSHSTIGSCRFIWCWPLYATQLSELAQAMLMLAVLFKFFLHIQLLICLASNYEYMPISNPSTFMTSNSISVGPVAPSSHVSKQIKLCQSLNLVKIYRIINIKCVCVPVASSTTNNRVQWINQSHINNNFNHINIRRGYHQHGQPHNIHICTYNEIDKWKKPFSTC